MSCFSLIVVLIGVFINVCTRFFTRQSIIVTDEIAAVGFVYCIFFGVSVCYKKKMHIAIDIVVNLFPENVKRIISVVTSFFMLFTNLMLTFFSFKLAISATRKLMPALGLSYFWIDISLVCAFGLCSFYAVRDLINLFKNKNQNISFEAPQNII
jgi:TRAP-type C4-dicarboxylate transport system permease small subunit